MADKNEANPAKNVKPTSIPVKTTREDGKKYRYTLDKNKR